MNFNIKNFESFVKEKYIFLYKKQESSELSDEELLIMNTLIKVFNRSKWLDGKKAKEPLFQLTSILIYIDNIEDNLQEYEKDLLVNLLSQFFEIEKNKKKKVTFESIKNKEQKG